jgi:WD repeat-containing protein 35
MLHEDQWFEEMINNRKKSTVEDIKWSNDGTKVCIIYEDGAVIVGSVDGSREWGKELPHNLSKVEWSPDNKLLIFATDKGDARVYSNLGIPMHKIKIYCFQDSNPEDKTVASIE